MDHTEAAAGKTGPVGPEATTIRTRMKVFNPMVSTGDMTSLSRRCLLHACGVTTAATLAGCSDDEVPFDEDASLRDLRDPGSESAQMARIERVDTPPDEYVVTVSEASGVDNSTDAVCRYERFSDGIRSEVRRALEEDGFVSKRPPGVSRDHVVVDRYFDANDCREKYIEYDGRYYTLDVTPRHVDEDDTCDEATCPRTVRGSGHHSR